MKNTHKAFTRLALSAVALGTLAMGCSSGNSEREATSAGSAVDEIPAATVDGPLASSNDEIIVVKDFHRPGELVSEWADMAQFLQYAAESVDTYWTAAYRAGGVKDPYVNVRWLRPTERVIMRCVDQQGTKVTTTDKTAAYCPADDTIYIAQKFASDLWSGAMSGPRGQRSDAQSLGDFAVAMVVAHEYGHNVQAELGITTALIGKQNFEQQADCLAGVWARAAESSSMLDPGDVEEALRTAWLFGDDGTDHGTSQQRMTAFTAGYQGGRYSACNRYGSPAR
jgi:predicted metalloprotease